MSKVVDKLSIVKRKIIDWCGHFVDVNKNALAKVIAKALIYVAPPVGFEPTTCPLGGIKNEGDEKFFIINYLNNNEIRKCQNEEK